jgi:hypothetical protein
MLKNNLKYIYSNACLNNELRKRGTITGGLKTQLFLH